MIDDSYWRLMMINMMTITNQINLIELNLLHPQIKLSMQIIWLYNKNRNKYVIIFIDTNNLQRWNLWEEINVPQYCTESLFTFYMLRKRLQIPVTINMDDVPKLTLIEYHTRLRRKSINTVHSTYILHIIYTTILTSNNSL